MTVIGPKGRTGRTGQMVAFQCLSDTGPGPCMNTSPHSAPLGCVHHSTSGVPDRHDRPGRGDGE